MFQLAADSIPHLAWIANYKGTVVWSNRRWFEFSGAAAGSAGQNSTWLDFIHPDHSEEILRSYHRAIAQGASWEAAFPLRAKNGQWRWFLGRAEPVRDEDGAFIQWVGTNTDITEQRDSTLRLEEQERQQRFFASLAHATQPLIEAEQIISTTARLLGDHLDCERCAYAEVSETGSYVMVTGDYARGVPSIVGRYDFADFGEECIGLLRAGRDYIITNLEKDSRLTEKERESFRRIDISSMICVPLLKNGKFVSSLAVHCQKPRSWKTSEIELVERTVALCWDSLERARITRNLLASEQKYKGLFNSIDQGFCIIRMLRDENGRAYDYEFLEVNPAFAVHTGIEDAAGKTIRHFAPSHEQYWMDFYDEVARTGQPAVFSNIAHGLEDQWFDVSAFRPEGHNEERVAVLFSNVSDRKRAATELQYALKEAEEARDAAEKASSAKTDFLTNMSHEIRTPMNAIVGLSQILSTSPGLTAKHQEYVRTLRTSATSLMALLNDLLDISKIETSMMELEHVPFSVARIAGEVIEMMSPQARQKGLEMHYHSDCACIDKRQFLGDPTRIRQILTNLCGNAVKFTERGTVAVHVSCLHMDRQDYERLIVRVEDTGIGIPADKIDSVFEKFAQADTSVNRKFGGSGLGLAISKKLAELMGGTITLSSEQGKGSVFTLAVDLPVSHSKSATPDMTEQNRGDRQDRILLVEDNEANILVASTYLEQFGYEYDVARTGVEAVAMAESGQYQIILMDIQMPVMGGLEATERIRMSERASGRSSVPIIGVTAHAFSQDEEKCLAAGMNAYLAKPYNPKELLHRLKACRQASDPAAA